MTSPVDEIAAPVSLGQSTDAVAAPAGFEAEDTTFGPDEARLVQMANLEVTLRLARAL